MNSQILSRGEGQVPDGRFQVIPMFKILMVEDNEIYRHMLRDLLKDRFSDITISEAGDAETAEGKIRENSLPDCILMDISLPGKNGLVLTREIKRDHPGTRIIILTNNDSQEHREAARESGADHFLCKGTMRVADILALIRELMPVASSKTN